MNNQKLTRGLVRENPILVMGLGLCPSLAVSTTLSNALGMSAATVAVLLGSNVVVSSLRNQIPDKVRIPAYIVIIASFVTLVDMIIQAYFPALSESLGIFIPLIVVNCIILGRAEAFAGKNGIGASALDAIAMGFGFTLGLTSIALVREILGSGTITLFSDGGVLRIPGLADAPARVFVFPAGALIAVGFLQALFRWIADKASARERKL